MVIPKQYNHYVYILNPGAVTKDANGDYVAAEPTWGLLGMGREETNGKGEQITLDDMKPYRFSALVQLPKGTPKVMVGTRVVVADEELTQDELRLYGAEGQNVNDAVRIVARCMKFDKGQLHCRMWL